MTAPNTSSGNSFWSRPEGKTGKGILVILGSIAALVGYMKVLPFLLATAWGTIELAIAAGIIYALYLLVTSKRVSSLLFYALESISRAITGIFVNIDPVGILMAFVKDLEAKKASVDEAITKMMGVRQASTNKRRQAEKEMDDFVKKASVAEENNLIIERDGMTEMAGRRQQMIESYDQNITFANDAIEALTRVKGVIEYNIMNFRDQAESLKTDNEMALQMLAATSAANAALGDTDKLDVQNMARDVIRDRVAKASGQVESLLESTRQMQGNMDLNKLVLKADGAAKLRDLQKRVAGAENNPAAPRMLTSGPATTVPVASGGRWTARISRNKS
jgi:hypothetical protein